MISLILFFVVVIIVIGIGIYKTKIADKKALESVLAEPMVIAVDDIFHDMDIQSEVPKVKATVKKPKKTLVKKSAIKKKSVKKSNKPKTKK